MSLNCLHCAAETNGIVLCKRCQQTTRTALDNIADYHGDLLGIGTKRSVRIRRSGVSDPTGSKATRELDGAIDRTPADLAAEARNDLVGWVRMLDDDRDTGFPVNTVTGISRHLARHLRSIATLDWAGDFTNACTDLERRMLREIQKGKGRWYAGICSAVTKPERPHDGMSCGCGCHVGLDLPCDIDGGCGSEFTVIDAELCDRDLYAEPGASTVRCPECKTVHRVSARRAILLAEAEDVLLPLTTIAGACSALLDEEPSVKKLLVRIRKWVDRGDLIWSDHDSGVRLYRVGDVLDLHARLAEKKRRQQDLQQVC